MELIFVYNAQSGKVNALLDTAHKIVSPSTYACNLCTLTFGSFRENEVWKEFREKSEVPMEFYHADEFENAFASKWLPKYSYPVVLLKNGGSFEIGISAEDFSRMKTLEQLMGAVHVLVTS